VKAEREAQDEVFRTKYREAFGPVAGQVTFDTRIISTTAGDIIEVALQAPDVEIAGTAIHFGWACGTVYDPKKSKDATAFYFVVPFDPAVTTAQAREQALVSVFVGHGAVHAPTSIPWVPVKVARQISGPHPISNQTQPTAATPQTTQPAPAQLSTGNAANVVDPATDAVLRQQATKKYVFHISWNDFNSFAELAVTRESYWLREGCVCDQQYDRLTEILALAGWGVAQENIFVHGTVTKAEIPDWIAYFESVGFIHNPDFVQYVESDQ
jgi:hypothetical protein